MTSWPPLLKRVPLAAAVTLAVGTLAEPAQALPGVGVQAGAGAHFANTGFAYTLQASTDVMGWGLGATYWNQMATSSSWVAAGLRKNMSPVPMISIAPGLGIANLSTPAGSAMGPLATVSGSFHPLMMPVALDASVGAAWLNGSPALPYTIGLKLSLIPFTALVARWRGWEGLATFKTSGPEIGAEIGF